MPVLTSDIESANNEGPMLRTVKLCGAGSAPVAMLSNFGATLTHLFVHDRHGIARDVVLGFDDPAAYDGPHSRYFGATVGRIANRIAGGQFALDGKNYQLAVNNGPNALHGGIRGFSHRVWNIVDTDEGDVNKPAVTFQLTSNHGDEGYPGTLEVSVRYELDIHACALSIDYSARLIGGDASSSIVNLTNHSYFNLSGGLEADILQHSVFSPATRFLQTDESLIPTGDVCAVSDAPALNFSRNLQLAEFVPSALPKGYDNFMVLPPLENNAELQLAARLTCTATGLQMTVTTTEPGFQLYTGYYNDTPASLTKTSHPANFLYGPFSGICFETQRFPDAVNHSDWIDSVRVTADRPYRQRTIFSFNCVD